jgi:hypothetical protein
MSNRSCYFFKLLNCGKFLSLFLPLVLHWICRKMSRPRNNDEVSMCDIRWCVNDRLTVSSKKGMGVWMIFIFLFNAEVLLDLIVMFPYNKIKLEIIFFHVFVLS